MLLTYTLLNFDLDIIFNLQVLTKLFIDMLTHFFLSSFQNFFLLHDFFFCFASQSDFLSQFPSTTWLIFPRSWGNIVSSKTTIFYRLMDEISHLFLCCDTSDFVAEIQNTHPSINNFTEDILFVLRYVLNSFVHL